MKSNIRQLCDFFTMASLRYSLKIYRGMELTKRKKKCDIEQIGYWRNWGKGDFSESGFFLPRKDISVPWGRFVMMDAKSQILQLLMNHAVRKKTMEKWERIAFMNRIGPFISSIFGFFLCSKRIQAIQTASSLETLNCSVS